MACSAPLSGWHSAEVNPTGKRSIVFHPSKAFTDMPVTIPCGQCLGCRADQSLMWSIRGYHESTQHNCNSFLTLTYDDTHLPADGKITKDELQRFFKRLRKKVDPVKLRYIACGEYGDQTRRPHYHAIIFGLDFLHDKVMINETLYTSPTLMDCWQKGHVSVAPVTMASICYVCGYVFKKMSCDDTFNLMSRRPGIGATWLDRYRDDLLRTGTVTIEGREYAIPPRYLACHEDYFEPVKKERRKYAKEQDKKTDPVTRSIRTRARDINRRALIKSKVEKL